MNGIMRHFHHDHQEEQMEPDAPESPEAVSEPVAPAEAPEGDTPSEEAVAPEEATEDAQTGSEDDAPAESDVERLERELADAKAAEAAQAKADHVAAGGEACPTCGANPPGTDEEGAREVWCPDCGAKLANLPEGH